MERGGGVVKEVVHPAVVVGPLDLTGSTKAAMLNHRPNGGLVQLSKRGSHKILEPAVHGMGAP